MHTWFNYHFPSVLQQAFDLMSFLEVFFFFGWILAEVLLCLGSHYRLTDLLNLSHFPHQVVSNISWQPNIVIFVDKGTQLPKLSFSHAVANFSLRINLISLSSMCWTKANFTHLIVTLKWGHTAYWKRKNFRHWHNSRWQPREPKTNWG